jgi:hypothetical protein
VGIYNRCTRLFGRNHCGNFNMEGLATDSTVFPECWKATLFFMALGLAVMGCTVVAAILGCCVQSIGRKSIFNLAGVAQAIAGNSCMLSSSPSLSYISKKSATFTTQLSFGVDSSPRPFHLSTSSQLIRSSLIKTSLFAPAIFLLFTTTL